MSSKYSTKQYISAQYSAKQMSEIWCKNIRAFLRYSNFRVWIFYFASPCRYNLSMTNVKHNKADPAASPPAVDFPRLGIGVGRRRAARCFDLRRFDLRRFFLPLTLARCGVSAPQRCIHPTTSPLDSVIFVCYWLTLTLYTLKAINYSATSNDTKLIHWLLMGGLLHLVRAGCGPAQSPPRCTKCNSLPINGQCTNHCIAM